MACGDAVIPVVSACTDDACGGEEMLAVWTWTAGEGFLLIDWLTLSGEFDEARATGGEVIALGG